MIFQTSIAFDSEPYALEQLALVFEKVANGLKTLHSQNIVHRDLHFGNVLARTVIHESEIPGKQAVESCALSDLGEGKVLDVKRELTVGSMSYGAGEFHTARSSGKAWMDDEGGHIFPWSDDEEDRGVREEPSLGRSTSRRF